MGCIYFDASTTNKGHDASPPEKADDVAPSLDEVYVAASAKQYHDDAFSIEQEAHGAALSFEQVHDAAPLEKVNGFAPSLDEVHVGASGKQYNDAAFSIEQEAHGAAPSFEQVHDAAPVEQARNIVLPNQASASIGCVLADLKLVATKSNNEDTDDLHSVSVIYSPDRVCAIKLLGQVDNSSAISIIGMLLAMKRMPRYRCISLCHMYQELLIWKTITLLIIYGSKTLCRKNCQILGCDRI